MNMSKTHWVAVPFVIAQALEAAGVIPEGVTGAVHNVFMVLFAGTVGHRVAKIMGLVGGPQ